MIWSISWPHVNCRNNYQAVGPGGLVNIMATANRFFRIGLYTGHSLQKFVLIGQEVLKTENANTFVDFSNHLAYKATNLLRNINCAFILSLLQSAFRSIDLNIIREAIQAVLSRLSDAEALCAPHITALEYLESDRDPAVLERQQPEMREAAQLLVDVFDEWQGQA
ncbi:MAG: hypothetical protein ACMUIA_07435 [bacterium]